MLIGRAKPADIPQIKALAAQSSTAAHWNEAQYEALLTADAMMRITLVAQNENDVLGFLIARSLADDWEIENIVVDDRYKRRGIGATLMRQLLAEAQSSGATSIILEVRESNAAARRLYESIGFKSEGRRKAYYHDPVEDAILYRRSLQFCDKIP